MSCVICEKSENLIFLRDGSSVHKKCIEYDVKPEIQNLREEIEVETSRLSRIEPNFTFWESIFGNRVKEEQAEINRQACREKIKRLESSKKKLSIKAKAYQETYGPVIQDSIRYWPGIPPSSIWQQIKEKQRKSQNNRCHFCKSKINLAGGHLLHIEALVKGGLNEENNIKLACNSCHKDLHAQKAKKIKLEQAFEKSNWSLFSHFEILNIAKEHDQKVLIEYVDENGEITTRWILIMDFKFEVQHGDRIWIRAHCLLRDAERSFRLDRFNSIEQLAANGRKA